MFASAHIIVVALKASNTFEANGSKRPHGLFRVAHSEVATGDKLTGDRRDLHGGGFIVLLRPHFEMTGIDAAALFQEITDGEGAFVVDNTFGLVDQLVAQL